MRYCYERGRLDGFGGRRRDWGVFGRPFFMFSGIRWFWFVSAGTSLASQANLDQFGDILVDGAGVSLLLGDPVLE